MKNFVKILIFSLFAFTTYAQQATEIDSKSVKLPRYANLAAIQAAIPSAQQGMMVYNIGTATNWYYNGTLWKNMEVSSVSIPTPLDLVSNSNTFSSETQDGTSNAIIGLNSSNGGGNGIFGQHKGNGWAGYFLGNNAISANGKTYLNGNVEIANSNWLEFGKGLTKQEDNGKIAYNAFGEANTLSIVGGGIANDGSDRKIKMWANLGTAFSGGASFDKSVNIGNYNLDPIGKLTINSTNGSNNYPTIAIIDDSPNNETGGNILFSNSLGTHQFGMQAHFGLQSDPKFSYLTFTKNGYYHMRLRGDGNLGIGVIDPALAGLVVNKKVGNSHAIFGDNTSGVSIESNFPGIHFNSYYNGSRKTISTGYTAGAEMNPTTGDFSIYTSPTSTTAGSTASVFERLKITKEGSVSVNQNLTINGEIKPSGISGIEGQVLQNNGNGTMSWQSIGSTMGYKKGKMIKNTGASSWIVPATVTEVMVEIWGAGAGSNGIVGGISGHYGRTVMTVTPSSVINFNIGLGGNGGIQDFGVMPGQQSTVTFTGGAFLTVSGGDKFNLDFHLLGSPISHSPTTNIDNAFTHNGNYGEPTVQVFGQKSSTIFTETKYFGIGGIPYGIDYKIPRNASFEYYENGVLIRSAPFPVFSYPACGGMIISSNTGRYGGDGLAIIWWN